MTQATPLTSPDEIRRLMHLDWAEAAARNGPPPGNDRAANLRNIIADPYHEAAFGELSLPDIMLISIYHLMEQHQWQQVWRAAAKLHRMEQDELKRAGPGPAPERDPTVDPVIGPRPPTTEDASSAPLPRAAHPATLTRHGPAPTTRRSPVPTADLGRTTDREPPFT